MGTSHSEYPSAQAYAAVLMALHCVQDTGSWAMGNSRPRPDASDARQPAST
jgi:hypothetical protein